MSKVRIPPTEYEITTMKASGPGGQHVNKAATAIQLRFDIQASSLPEAFKEKLLARKDKRISSEGIIVIKVGQYRSQLKNKETAIRRLHELIEKSIQKRKKRISTHPTQASKERRIKSKKRRSEIKKMRRKID